MRRETTEEVREKNKDLAENQREKDYTGITSNRRLEREWTENEREWERERETACVNGVRGLSSFHFYCKPAVLREHYGHSELVLTAI